MPKGDKYIGLKNYLQGKNEKTIVMSFAEIEARNGETLPASAYKHRAFWSNTRTHSIAFGWLDTEYKTVGVDFKEKYVTFVRE